MTGHSLCCNAPVRVGGEGSTHYYICNQCEKPCGILEYPITERELTHGCEVPLADTPCFWEGCKGQAYTWPSGGVSCYAHYELLTQAKILNKYHAVRTNGFDSAKEERRYRELLMMQQGGAIEQLECQVVYVLCEKPSVKVVVDFRYIENGQTVLADVKGIDKRTGKPVTLTACARVKYAWLEQKTGLSVKIF